MTPLLVARGLTVTGPGGAPLVARADFALAPGELVALVGPSGSGKSTFLRAVCGRTPLRVTADVLRWGDVEPLRAGFAGLLGRVVVHVPQEAGAGLDPYRTVGRQLDAAARGDGTPHLRALGFAEADLPRVRAARAHALSGGMAERAALALGLATGARVLLCDEPTTGLDVLTRATVLAALRAVAQGDRAVVVVTHDRAAAERVADRVVACAHGRLRPAGPPPGSPGAPAPGTLGPEAG